MNTPIVDDVILLVTALHHHRDDFKASEQADQLESWIYWLTQAIVEYQPKSPTFDRDGTDLQQETSNVLDRVCPTLEQILERAKLALYHSGDAGRGALKLYEKLVSVRPYHNNE